MQVELALVGFAAPTQGVLGGQCAQVAAALDFLAQRQRLLLGAEQNFLYADRFKGAEKVGVVVVEFLGFFAAGEDAINHVPAHGHQQV